jgi:hypothetical protein
MAEGLIMGVLRENNIELSENTFRFHLKLLLEKHGGLFESMIARIGRENVLENLCVIYQELEPSNFGRIMAYLTLVFKVSDFCEPEIVQEAVKICVWELKQVDSASFEIKQSWMQRLIAWLRAKVINCCTWMNTLYFYETVTYRLLGNFD